MSFTHVITADRRIERTDVRAIITQWHAERPMLFITQPLSEQSWGWAAECDIFYPDGNTLSIYGSNGAPARIGPWMARAMVGALTAKGYTVTLTLDNG